MADFFSYEQLYRAFLNGGSNHNEAENQAQAFIDKHYGEHYHDLKKEYEKRDRRYKLRERILKDIEESEDDLIDEAYENVFGEDGEDD